MTRRRTATVVSMTAAALLGCAACSGGNGTQAATPSPSGSVSSSASSSGSASSAASTSAPAGTPTSGGTTKPNVIFVLTDDLAWNLVQYMPHVQAMEKAGTTLQNYEVVDSLCCPSRSALLTGQYPHDNGVFTNMGNDGGYDTYQRNNDAAKAWGPALQNSGYRTGFMGKYLNGYQPTDPVPPGWNTWDVAGNGYPEYNYTLNENGKQVKYGKQPTDYLTDVVSGKASSFISGAAQAHQPFALELATFAPHQPATPAPRDADTFGDLKAPRTPAYDATGTNAPSWLGARPALSDKNETAIDKLFRKRVQSTQAVDDMIGHLEDTLKQAGVADNTYIVFSSDNGFHMGDHKLLPGKQTAFDTDIRVPMMITGPGVPAGHQVTAMTSSIDLAPTFEQIAGRAPSPDCDGVSMLSLWHGAAPPSTWQKAVLIEHHGPDNAKGDPDRQGKGKGMPPTYEAIRTADHSYVSYANGQREFYDLRTDPYELHNLAGTSSAATLAPYQRTVLALSQCHGATQCQAAARM